MALDAWIVRHGSRITCHGSRITIVSRETIETIRDPCPRITHRESLSPAWIHSPRLSDQIPSIVSRETIWMDHAPRITEKSRRKTDHGSRAYFRKYWWV